MPGHRRICLELPGRRGRLRDPHRAGWPRRQSDRSALRVADKLHLWRTGAGSAFRDIGPIYHVAGIPCGQPSKRWSVPPRYRTLRPAGASVQEPTRTFGKLFSDQRLRFGAGTRRPCPQTRDPVANDRCGHGCVAHNWHRCTQLGGVFAADRFSGKQTSTWRVLTYAVNTTKNRKDRAYRQSQRSCLQRSDAELGVCPGWDRCPGADRMGRGDVGVEDAIHRGGRSTILHH